ncbi:MAG: DUF2065 domain-containing protein [Pseudomonadota bacterium]|nr:DUF2065 domain-containing protein [Pseudomonadota bacterium]
MNETVTIVLAAFGLVLAIEGILFSLFPGSLKRAMERIMVMPIDSIKLVGISTAFTGVLILWLVLS